MSYVALTIPRNTERDGGEAVVFFINKEKRKLRSHSDHSNSENISCDQHKGINNVYFQVKRLN